MTSSLRKVVCMFRIKFPTKRIFRIFPILRTDGMAPFGTYLWNDPTLVWCYCLTEMQVSQQHRHRLTVLSVRRSLLPLQLQHSRQPVQQLHHRQVPALLQLLDPDNRNLSLANSRVVGRRRKVPSGSADHAEHWRVINFMWTIYCPQRRLC